MSSTPKPPPAGAQPATLLLPFLVVAVLGGVAVIGHMSGSSMNSGDDNIVTASAYAPEAFTPRFIPLWTMLLRNQYGAVTRYSTAIRMSVRPDDRARAEAEYRVCLHEYDWLAARVPTRAFAGQHLPHYLPETTFPSPGNSGPV